MTQGINILCLTKIFINKTIVMINVANGTFETMLPQDMISTTSDPYIVEL
jgi:hypothetical protein